MWPLIFVRNYAVISASGVSLRFPKAVYVIVRTMILYDIIIQTILSNDTKRN